MSVFYQAGFLVCASCSHALRLHTSFDLEDICSNQCTIATVIILLLTTAALYGGVFGAISHSCNVDLKETPCSSDEMKVYLGIDSSGNKYYENSAVIKDVTASKKLLDMSRTICMKDQINMWVGCIKSDHMFKLLLKKPSVASSLAIIPSSPFVTVADNNGHACRISSTEFNSSTTCTVVDTMSSVCHHVCF